MSDDWVWAWRLAIITALGALAWLMKNTLASFKDRMDKFDTQLDEHIAEDRLRFDHILASLGEVKGKLDMLIGRFNPK